MTPEQLDELLAIADRGAYLAPSDPSAGFEARAAAASDLAAMRQPITAEALTAAGWVYSEHDEVWFIDVHGRLTVEFNIAEEFSVALETPCRVSRLFPGIRTMYALGQLVELLGGGK